MKDNINLYKMLSFIFIVSMNFALIIVFINYNIAGGSGVAISTIAEVSIINSLFDSKQYKNLLKELDKNKGGDK